jgi:hypothetical protein
LREKIPGLTPQYFLGSDPKVLSEKMGRAIEAERARHESKIQLLEQQLEQLKTSHQQLRRRLLGFFAMTLVLVLIFAASKALAQGDLDDKVTPDRHLVPIVYYTPETKLAGGALSIFNFGQPVEGKTSQVIGVASVTANGQSLLNFSPRYFLSQGSGEIQGLFSARYFPSKYFGSGKNQSDGESYTERALDLGFWQNQVLHGPFSVRWGFHSEKREILDHQKGGSGILEETLKKQGQRQLVLGASLGLEWDQRNFSQSPTEGQWIRLQATRWSPEDLDGNLNLAPFHRGEIDGRLYQRHEEVQMAHQVYVGEVSGRNVPFQYLQTVGGGSRMRGYYFGRFRDHALVMVQSEARMALRDRWSISSGLSYGRLAATIAEIGSNHDLWTGSIGCQYLLDRLSRTKLRADLGFGHRPYFYFLFGDAF